MNSKKMYYVLMLLLLFSGTMEAQPLKVFDAIPGLTPSLHYKCRVKLQSEPETAWRPAFVMQSQSLNNPTDPAPGQSTTGLDNGFFKEQFGWTSSHIAFESMPNEIVQVEVSLVNGALINKSSLITKAIVKPYGEATVSISSDNKKVIVTFNKHTNVYLDINGQMEDQYTGDSYSDDTNKAKIHTLCIFSNPIYTVPTDAALLTPAWSQTVGNEVQLDYIFGNGPGSKSDARYESERVAKNDLKPAGKKKFVFGPGVHNISTQFPIRSDEEYYIPGDAIVYGTFLPEANAANIKVIGSGTICGSKGRWGGKYVGVPSQSPSDAKENKTFTGNAGSARLEGFVVVDPINHTFNMGSIGTAINVYKNLKILGWRKNGDGLNAFDNSVVSECFFRVQDDAFYLGKNVKIQNCTTWTDANGAVMYLASSDANSYFKDIKVIYNRKKTHSWNSGVISMRNTDGPIENVLCQNITVEDPRPTVGLFYFTVNLAKEAEKAPTTGFALNNIVFDNITQAASREDGKEMDLLGSTLTKFKNVTFKNCKYKGACLSSLDDGNWKYNNFDKASIKFEACGSATVAVASVTVSPTTLSIPNGQQGQLAATVSPSNATNKNVTWSSSNTAVASVNSNGLVTANAVGGPVTITATTVDGSKTATSTITVTPSCSLPWSAANFNISATTVNYTSGPVDISCASAVKLSLKINGTTGVMETNQDYLKVSYRVNGGAIVLAKEIWGNFPVQDVVVPGISGSTLELIITGYTSATTEIYSVSNISIVSDGGATKQNQTITFPAIASKVTGTADFNPGATASSGLAVSYTSSNTAVATIVNGNIRVLAAGTSIITASQTGNTTYNPAANVSQIITVTGTTTALNVVSLTPWVSGTTHPKASGSNRLLVVMVSGEHSAPFSVSGVTYDGKPMKKENDRGVGSATGFNNYTSIFTLKEADISTASSGTIQVNFINATGGIISPSSGSSVYSAFLANVNQTTPTKNLVANSELAASSISTADISTVSGDLVLFSGASSVDGTTTTATVGNSFTKVFESNTGWGDGIGASKQGTGASEIPTFTTASGRLAICALAVNKSSGTTSRIRNDQATLSVEENLISGTTIKLYPNPVSSILTIESGSNSEKEITVVNTLGQVVYKTKSKSSNTQIDMKSLNLSGLVLVKIIEEGKVSNHKVMVK